MAAMVLSKKANGILNARMRPLRARNRTYSGIIERTKPNLGKAILTTSGGAAAGVVNAYMPEVMGVKTPLVVGSAFVATALYLGNDAKAGNDGMAYTLLCLGSGMLAVSVAEITEKHFRTATQSQTINGGMAVVNGV